ncbi:MAG: hypothetical protein J6U54_05600 [Clostridiales bacterium]|nr:hypothetical protein [Clostridiales bacterium]
MATKKSPPAFNDDEREKQLIALAYDEVERRIRNHEATSQELVHFLRMGSSREKQERKIMVKNEELLGAKTESIQNQKSTEIFMQDALLAFKVYAGDEDGQML